jgi:hypothetical protein
MGDVVQFPVAKVQKDNKVGTCRIKMANLQKMLDKRYDRLHELTLEMEKVSDDCDKCEKDYEVVLTEYANRVGAGNVEIKYLDYSSEVEILFDADTNNFKITHIEPEIETDFKPADEDEVYIAGEFDPKETEE